MSFVTKPLVDIVVPTFGKPTLLAACLRSLRQMHVQDYRLIVVDDCGDPPALPIVQQEHPGAMVLRARSNGGLVRALNKGISAGTAPYVALLNDDTEVDPNWLGALVEAAETTPEAGSIASKMLLYDQPDVFHSAGDGFGIWGMPFNREVWLPDLGQANQMEIVFGACAGAALYRRTALKSIRLRSGDVLDQRLWMYLEDVDLAWRLQNGGFACMYQPDAVVHHHLSASGGGNIASYQVSRNIWHIVFVSMPRPLLRKHWRRIAAHHLGRNLRHLRHVRSPEARASLRGTIAGPLFALARATEAPREAPDGIEGLLAF